MNKYIKYSLLGLTLILNIFWAYFIVNAWLWTDGLTAQSWDTLTAAKWNAMLQKTSDWWNALSTNYVSPWTTNVWVDIPWLTKTIDLPRDAKILVSVAWSTYTPSNHTRPGYRIVFDWVAGWAVVYSMWTSAYTNFWTNWSINDGKDLTAWTHTIKVQTNGDTSTISPWVCWAWNWYVWYCSMNIMAFY